MTEEKLYYKAPSDEIFEEVKKASIAIWTTKSKIGGYSDEKVAQVERITNIRDNFMHIVAMFDIPNQRILANLINDEAKWEINIRMESGDQPSWANPFIQF